MPTLNDRRIEKLGRELTALEAEFRETLIAALRHCADGSWGLFGQNDHVWPPHAHHRDPGVPDAEALLALGEQIADLRRVLGHAEPFELHDRLLALRGRKDPNAPGEAKLARRWLDELEKPTP